MHVQRLIPSRFTLIAFALIFLCLQVAVTSLLPSHTHNAIYPFQILAPLIATVACVTRSLSSRGRARISWMIFAIAIALWTSGMAIAAWEDSFAQSPITLANASDFIYFLYGVPLLILLSLPRSFERFQLFFWLDAIQAVLLGILFFTHIFGALPFMQSPLQPASDTLLVVTYNTENLLLCLIATFRLAILSDRGDLRRRYIILTIFLWLYAACAASYNLLYMHLVTLARQSMGFIELLPVLPFVFLTVAVLTPSPYPNTTGRTTPANTAELFFDTASPILYTLTVIAMGIILLPKHFALGVASIVLALIIYAIRSATLQTRYIRSEASLRVAHDRLAVLSHHDALTGIANRRRFDTVLEQEWNRATRTQSPLSLILIDIDHFKQINDVHGHLFGDSVLQQVATALQDALPRSGDLLARYGGEEFAVILANSDPHGALVVATRMVEAVRSITLPESSETQTTVTISAGIATYQPPQDSTQESLIAEADTALYKAKHNGRNRAESSVTIH